MSSGLKINFHARLGGGAHNLDAEHSPSFSVYVRVYGAVPSLSFFLPDLVQGQLRLIIRNL
jgi:hypothetical protein